MNTAIQRRLHTDSLTCSDVRTACFVSFQMELFSTYSKVTDVNEYLSSSFNGFVAPCLCHLWSVVNPLTPTVDIWVQL